MKIKYKDINVRVKKTPKNKRRKIENYSFLTADKEIAHTFQEYLEKIISNNATLLMPHINKKQWNIKGIAQNHSDHSKAQNLDLFQQIKAK